MDKQTEIAKLRRLLVLRTQHANLSQQIQHNMHEKRVCDETCSGQIAAREKEIKNMLAANCPAFNRKCNAPAVYSHTAKIPPEKPVDTKRSIRLTGTLVVSTVLTLTFFSILFQALIGQLKINIWTVLLFMAGGPALGVLCVHLYQFIGKPKQAAYKKQYDEYLLAEKELNRLQSTYRTEAQNSAKDYLERLATYEEQYKEAVVRRMRALSFYQKAMEELPQYKAKCVAECEQKKKACDQRIEAAQHQLAECNQDIEQINILHSSYWSYLSTIITLLETGRADTCKEALNIAIEQEEKRKHQERMEEIAQERARAEANRTEEERRHNREMERQAEESSIRAAVDAKLQADRERSEQRAADEKRKYAGQRRCMSCANRSRCPNDMIARGDGLNCGAYTPR